MPRGRTIRLLTPVSTPETGAAEGRDVTFREVSREQNALGLLDNTKPPGGQSLRP